MRKHKLSKSLALCGGLLSLIACDNSLEHQLEGKWQLKSVEQNGQIETVDTVRARLLLHHHQRFPSADRLECLQADVPDRGIHWQSLDTLQRGQNLYVQEVLNSDVRDPFPYIRLSGHLGIGWGVSFLF